MKEMNAPQHDLYFLFPFTSSVGRTPNISIPVNMSDQCQYYSLGGSSYLDALPFGVGGILFELNLYNYILTFLLIFSKVKSDHFVIFMNMFGFFDFLGFWGFGEIGRAHV